MIRITLTFMLILLLSLSPIPSVICHLLTNVPTDQPSGYLPTAEAAQRLPRMYLLGEEVHTDPPPLLLENRLLIPLRFVAEAAGASVSYDSVERKATIKNNVSVVEIRAAEKSAMVNGIPQEMDVPALLQDGRLFIPLRFWLENAGFSVIYDQDEGVVHIDEDTALRAEILSFAHPRGEYYPGEAAVSNLTFMNSSHLSGTFWIGYSVRDMEGRWYDISASPVDLEAGDRATLKKTWQVPQDHVLVSGPFMAVMAVWDAPPGSREARRLDHAEVEAAFTVFNVKEDFSSFDQGRWVKGNYRIGESELCPENVEVQDGKLRITIPANTLEGGSIRTREHYLYGSYRASIRVADAPSSITGFFLYKQPDYYHEIDIEIYNDHTRRIMFVTYAGGKRTNRQMLRLDFDPRAAFHEYRFDFYSSGVHFYIDGQLLKSWTEGLTVEPMQLMFNTWFPDWLAGEIPPSDRHTYVEWIKY